MALHKDIVENILAVADAKDAGKDQEMVREYLEEILKDSNETALAGRVLSSVVKFLESHQLLTTLQRRTIQRLIADLSALEKSPDSEDVSSGYLVAADAKVQVEASASTNTADVVAEDVRATQIRSATPLDHILFKDEAPPKPRSIYTPSQSTGDTNELSVQHHGHNLYKAYPKGAQMLGKHGWTPGTGLGATGEGIKVPVADAPSMELGKLDLADSRGYGAKVKGNGKDKGKGKAKEEYGYAPSEGKNVDSFNAIGNADSQEPDSGPSQSTKSAAWKDFAQNARAHDEQIRKAGLQKEFGHDTSQDFVLTRSEEFEVGASSQPARGTPAPVTLDKGPEGSLARQELVKSPRQQQGSSSNKGIGGPLKKRSPW
ncbi:hypothetical protein F5B20DRAFT_563693 [Whalleya microplaca]|nr:hypothetical protein F5B20DRAFT_563693 [Whalleya microplaca]